MNNQIENLEITLTISELENLLSVMKNNQKNNACISGVAKLKMCYSTDYRTFILEGGRESGYQFNDYQECNGVYIDINCVKMNIINS